MTSIERCAFSKCSNLTNVVIPDSVTYIGYEAFLGCEKLTNIIIPDSVTCIIEDAFRGAACEEEVKQKYAHLFRKPTLREKWGDKLARTIAGN